MQSVDNATRAALDSSAIHVRILEENSQLFVPSRIPVHDPSGPPLFVIAASAFSGGVLDGTILSLGYSAACSDGDIGIGSVSSASISAQIQGVYSLLGLVLRAQYGVEVNGSIVWKNLGSFTVTDCTTTDHSTQFTAYDAAYTLTGEYKPKVLSGSTVKAILSDLSVQAGIEVEPPTLAMGENIHTDGSLSGKNYREMLGYLAGLCGKNAVVTRDGAIKFLWYASSGAEVTADDYYSGEMSNGGVSNFAGISCTVRGTEDAREDTVLTAGNAEKAVEYTNPYMTQERLDAIWSDIGNYSYPVGTVGFYHGMLTEPGDIINLTNLSGVTIHFPVMHTELAFDGGCRCSVSSWGKSDEVRADKYLSPTNKAVQRVLDNVANGVYDGTSVKSVTRYYQLANDTPAKPTTLNPGATWTTTEPTYSENNPDHLYFVDRTVYDNDTYQYSTVSLSSSYEAAKAAYQRAQEAQEAAEDAMEAAEDAMEEAQGAMTSANGKNRVYHQSTTPTAPAGGHKVGDVWFDTSMDNQVAIWSGSGWSVAQFGEDAIANLSITNAKIKDATIQGAKIAGLDAGKITSGTLDAARIGAKSIDASKINVTSLFAQDITAKGNFSINNPTYTLEASQYGVMFQSDDGSMSIYGEDVIISAENGGCSIYGDYINIGDEESDVTIGDEDSTITIGKGNSSVTIGGSLSVTGNITGKNITAINIASVTRVAKTVTTGATGNIITDYANDGHTYVIAPLVSGRAAFLRAWVSSANGYWYLTAVDPNTGATINNAELAIRYLVVKINNM